MPETQPPASAEPKRLLESLASPLDLKRLAPGDLPKVCAEMRGFLLDSVQKTGGHLGSNLGTVEITTALHYVFDFRRDRLVFDVSHQAYPHKLLTGRRDRFATLRQTGGLCGFTNPHESDYDLFHTGHAGTAISLALGLTFARGSEARPPEVVALVGDAALGAGVAFEALNHAAASGQRLLVVLNDNEWSISRSVGALARYLSRIRSNRLVQRAHQEVQSLISAIPLIGPRVDRALEQIGEVVRHAVVPGHIFEELGVTYVGPIDGHDVNLLVEHLERARTLDGVVLLHILTEKGKGHPKARLASRARARRQGRPRSPRSGADTPKLAPADGARAAHERAGVSRKRSPTRSIARRRTRRPRARDHRRDAVSGTGPGRVRRALPGALPRHGHHRAARIGDGGRDGQGRPAADRGDLLDVPAARLRPGLPGDRAAAPAGGASRSTAPGLVGRRRPDAQRRLRHRLPAHAAGSGARRAARRDATSSACSSSAFKQDAPFFAALPARQLSFGRGAHPPQRAPRPWSPGKAEVLCEGERDLVIWAYGALVKPGARGGRSAWRRQAALRVGLVDARFAKPIDTELLAKPRAAVRAGS